jgi:hypothetical protein
VPMELLHAGRWGEMAMLLGSFLQIFLQSRQKYTSLQCGISSGIHLQAEICFDINSGRVEIYSRTLPNPIIPFQPYKTLASYSRLLRFNTRVSAQLVGGGEWLFLGHSWLPGSWRLYR